MFKPLEVDFYKSKDFWDKPQEERYKYFKMFNLAFIGMIDFPEDKEVAIKYNDILTQLAIFVIFLCTTDEERENDIELDWLDRFQKEAKASPFADKPGEA
tara:strand:+ start:246 stop:545 length:300 start_codon:yes stop_codon:yes gene_type:complete